MRKLQLRLAVTALLGLSAVPAVAAENPAIAAEIISLVRQQWDAEIAGKPAPKQAATMANDYTEFGEDFPVLFAGKPLMIRYGQAPSSSKTVYAEMLNPKVQVYGNTAILTYNYLGYSKGASGEIKPSLSKSSRVYVKDGARWMLVHAHFSHATARS
ncbi:MAG: nuclear transport factor 2 family protein [Sphingomonas sp.]|nr:nuclear transport factor 2 family protein [Sphingomonas sp.]